MDTLRVPLGLIRGLALFSRHHSPSLSIVDEFNWFWQSVKRKLILFIISKFTHDDMLL